MSGRAAEIAKNDVHDPIAVMAWVVAIRFHRAREAVSGYHGYPPEFEMLCPRGGVNS